MSGCELTDAVSETDSQSQRDTNLLLMLTACDYVLSESETEKLCETHSVSNRSRVCDCFSD